MDAKSLGVVGVEATTTTPNDFDIKNSTLEDFDVEIKVNTDKRKDTKAEIDEATGKVTVTLNMKDDSRLKIDATNEDVLDALKKVGIEASMNGSTLATAEAKATIGKQLKGVEDSGDSKTLKGINVSSQVAANKSITKINDAINTVSNERFNLGAMQNRLEHTINNLGASSENLIASESRIRDVDMAKEMMTFSKNNILQQAAQAMLAQANQQPQGVLQLLR